VLPAFLNFGCPGLLCNPGGPGIPFGNPALVFIDSVRVITVLCAALVVGTSLRASFAARVGPAQTARFYGLAAFALSAGTTEIVHLGDYASYRLFLNIVGAGLSLWGVCSFLRENNVVRQ